MEPRASVEDLDISAAYGKAKMQGVGIRSRETLLGRAETRSKGMDKP